MKKILSNRALVAAVVVLLLGTGGFFAVRAVSAKSTSVPTAVVKRGDFVEYLQIRGEIKARYSKILTAPSGSGDLQIVKLTHTGTQVKKDEVILQFDPTNLQRTLEQKQTDLKSADAEIQQQRAEGHMTEEQNLTRSEERRVGKECRDRR